MLYFNCISVQLKDFFLMYTHTLSHTSHSKGLHNQMKDLIFQEKHTIKFPEKKDLLETQQRLLKHQSPSEQDWF